MLVCSVSQSQRRASIAADVAEAAAAADAPGTGNVVFATLVDDPASVGDRVDAFLGQIMREAASAAATVNAGFAYAGAVSEAASAADTASSSVPVAVFATWDPATVAAVTLSGGNLVATNTGTTSASQGAMGAASAGKTSGKHYFEITLTNLGTGGGNRGVGIGTTASTYGNMGGNAVFGDMMFPASGNIWSNGGSTGSSLGARSTGQPIGIAADLDNRTIWFRVAPSGNWNNSGTANPATNTGGVVVPAGTMVPFCTFGGSGGVSGVAFTANFGASSFTGAVPSGFTSGWMG